jgi:hypothetical protein
MVSDLVEDSVKSTAILQNMNAVGMNFSGLLMAREQGAVEDIYFFNTNFQAFYNRKIYKRCWLGFAGQMNTNYVIRSYFGFSFQRIKTLSLYGSVVVGKLNSSVPLFIQASMDRVAFYKSVDTNHIKSIEQRYFFIPTIGINTCIVLGKKSDKRIRRFALNISIRKPIYYKWVSKNYYPFALQIGFSYYFGRPNGNR